MKLMGDRPRSDRLVRAFKMAFLLVVVCSGAWFASFDSGPALAAAGDETSGLTVKLVETYESISVYASFTGDANGNNQSLLEYRQAGTSRWIQGMAMTADRRGTICGTNTCFDGDNQWRASVLMVSPATTYEVRVTLTDVDGVSGSPVVTTVTTWKETDQIPSVGRSLYVAPGGSDSSGDGSEGSPYATIQRAADEVLPGDTVFVKAGTYALADDINLTRSGDPDNYITFRNFGSDTVVIDIAYRNRCGGTYPTGCAFAVTGSYLRIKGFDIVSTDGQSSKRGIKVYESAHDIIIEDMFIEVRGCQSHGIKVKSWFTSPVEDRPKRITIQRTTMDIYETGTCPDGLQTTGPGIDVEYGGGQFVFRDNRIEYFGTTLQNKHGRDCFVAHPNFEPEAGYWDTDIHDNQCINGTDDAVSLDGGSANVRVWGNHFSGTMIGISIAPVLVGPAYIFRNVIEELRQHWSIYNCNMFKIGEGGTGSVYIFHNTMYTVDRFMSPAGKECRRMDGLNHGAEPKSKNIFASNNIFEINGRVVSDAGEKPIMDYNLWFDHDTENWSLSLARWAGVKYFDFDSFKAGTGQEQNGVWGQATFIDRANDDYRLADGSLGIDQGGLILGFNDPDSAWPFLGAAPDIGAFEAPDPDPNAPPFRFNPSPSGELPAGTTQATLGLTTSKQSTCRYSTTPGVAYDSMTSTFQSTGTTVHSSVVGGLADGGSYAYYVRCKAVTANPDDFVISFSVRAPDTTPPVITNLAATPDSISAQVTWDTDDTSDARIDYGPSPSG